MNFSEYVKQLRAGENTEWFAGVLGISQSGLSRVEKGEYNPSLKTLKGVAKFTGRTVDDLIKSFRL